MTIVGLNHGLPVFGKVDQVLVVDATLVILRYSRLRVLEYVSHLNAYKVVEVNELTFVKQKKLQDFHPLGFCKGFGPFTNDFFVVLRYRVDCLN